MTWMLTASGTEFDMHHMPQVSISVDDIAHHLAQINRFNGACIRPYSVAEHSLLVCEIYAYQNPGAKATELLAALLHDAHEAFVGDVTSPVKQAMAQPTMVGGVLFGNAYERIEGRAADAVQRRFGIVVATRVCQERILRADLTALMTERTQLLSPAGPRWVHEASHPPYEHVDLASRKGLDWTDWRRAFADRFDELDYARGIERRTGPVFDAIAKATP